MYFNHNNMEKILQERELLAAYINSKKDAIELDNKEFLKTFKINFKDDLEDVMSEIFNEVCSLKTSELHELTLDIIPSINGRTIYSFSLIRDIILMYKQGCPDHFQDKQFIYLVNQLLKIDNWPDVVIENLEMLKKQSF